MTKLEKLLKDLTVAENESNAIDAAFEADPENAELERAADELYKKEFALYITAAIELVKITNRQMTMDIAKKMIKTNRNDIINLLKKYS